MVWGVFAGDIAVVQNVKGDVIAKNASQTFHLKTGDSLDEKMVILTKDKSSVVIVFNDSSILTLSSNTILSLEKYLFKPTEKKYDFRLFLKRGKAAFRSGKIGKLSPESFEFKTPDGVVGIRGTYFLVSAP